MAHVNSLRFVWEMADSSYIQATNSGGRTPAGRRRCSDEMSWPERDLPRADNGSESEREDSYSQTSSGSFAAIPAEFRPTKQGRDLLKVRASAKRDDSKVKVNAEKPLQNDGRYSNKPHVPQRNRSTENSNSSAIQNKTWNYKKESLKIDESEKPQRDADVLSDETGKPKISSGKFFYDSSSRNTSTSRTTKERPPYMSGKENNNQSEWSGSSEVKDKKDENTQCKFFSSNSGQSKVTNKMDNHSSFSQNKDEVKFPKFNKIAAKFQDQIASSHNKAPFVEKEIQKITRETIVTKRIQWNNELCKFNKPESKPNVFYKYTKSTKKSTSCVSSHCEDDVSTKRPYQVFKKECNQNARNFQRQQSNPEQLPKTLFDQAPRREANHSTLRWEERHDRSHYADRKDEIIVRHEIKVIHVNRQSKNNRRPHNSSQNFRPPKKDGNGKRFNAGDKHHFGANRDTTGENTIAKTTTTESFQKTRENYVRLTDTDLSAKTEQINDTVSHLSNGDSNEKAATLMWYGSEISDMIAGCYVAISTFLDNYEQWKDLRRVTMLLFEESEKNLSQSRNKNKRIIEIAEMVGSGCKMVQYVPHAGVSTTAKVIAGLSDIVSRMFSSSKSAKSIDMDDFQLRLCLQKDMDATTDIYLYGIQCDTQFQDTCELIEKFHGEIQDGRFNGLIETFETGFLKKISQLSPKHPEVFYKGLGRFYEHLNDLQQSEEGEAFCRAFKDWPDALTTISRLYRRFKKDNWDSSSVMKAWEDIYNILQNDQAVVEDVLKKVQDCIFVLTREQSIMDKYVMDLQRQY